MVILHFAVLEEVIPWVSLHFSIFSVDAPPVGGATSGSVGILHCAVLEGVIVWVSLQFSIFSVGAAPMS